MDVVSASTEGECPHRDQIVSLMIVVSVSTEGECPHRDQIVSLMIVVSVSTERECDGHLVTVTQPWLIVLGYRLFTGELS